MSVKLMTEFFFFFSLTLWLCNVNEHDHEPLTDGNTNITFDLKNVLVKVEIYIKINECRTSIDYCYFM